MAGVLACGVQLQGGPPTACCSQVRPRASQGLRGSAAADIVCCWLGPCWGPPYPTLLQAAAWPHQHHQCRQGHYCVQSSWPHQHHQCRQAQYCVLSSWPH